MSNKVEGQCSIGVFLPGVVVTLLGAGDVAVNRMGFGGSESCDSSGQSTQGGGTGGGRPGLHSHRRLS